MNSNNSKLLIQLADLLEANRESIVGANTKDVCTSYGINNDNLTRGISTLRAYSKRNINKSKAKHGTAIYSCYGDPSFGIFGLTLAPAILACGTEHPLVIGFPSILKNYHAEICRIFSESNILPNIICTIGRKAFLDSINDSEIKNIVIFGDSWISDLIPTIQANDKNLSFYGPGNNASIITKGADLQKAIKDTLECSFVLNGQAAVCIERCVVDDRLNKDEVISIFKDELSKIKVGTNPFNASNLVTPIIAKPLIELTKSFINELDPSTEIFNFKIDELDNGYLMHPALAIGCNTDSRIWKNFTFTPILPIVFSKFEDIPDIVNNTKFEIYNSIWGNTNEFKILDDKLNNNHIFNLHNKGILEHISIQNGYTEVWGGYKNSGFIINKNTGMKPVEGGFMLYELIE